MVRRNSSLSAAVLLPVLLVSALGKAHSEEMKPAPPFEPLPPGVTRLTHFGERADWAPDGLSLIFVEKTFGDVYRVDTSGRTLVPLTHPYFHEGYTRALHLSSGDVLLSGAPEFDARNPWRSRNETAELWLLRKPFDRPPVPLGTRCTEGPAVSRRSMRIAWTIDHGDYPDRILLLSLEAAPSKKD